MNKHFGAVRKPGKHHFSGIMMYDYGARYYDPVLGRWHSQDPLIAYASPYNGIGNNPVNLIDRWGMCPGAAPEGGGGSSGGYGGGGWSLFFEGGIPNYFYDNGQSYSSDQYYNMSWEVTRNGYTQKYGSTDAGIRAMNWEGRNEQSAIGLSISGDAYRKMTASANKGPVPPHGKNRVGGVPIGSPGSVGTNSGSFKENYGVELCTFVNMVSLLYYGGIETGKEIIAFKLENKNNPNDFFYWGFPWKNNTQYGGDPDVSTFPYNVGDYNVLSWFHSHTSFNTFQGPSWKDVNYANEIGLEGYAIGLYNAYKIVPGVDYPKRLINCNFTTGECTFVPDINPICPTSNWHGH